MWELENWGCCGAAIMLIRPWVHSHTQNRVFRGRLKHTHAHATHTLLHNQPLKHLFLLYTDTRAPGAEVNAVPGGLQKRGRGIERWFGLPAELLSSGQQAPAPPGPHKKGIFEGFMERSAAQGWESRGKTYRHLSWGYTHMMLSTIYALSIPLNGERCKDT